MKEGQDKQAAIGGLVDGIKRVTRGAGNVLTGANVTPTDRVQRNKELALWLLGGGLGLGALGGAGVAATKYVNDMKREDDAADPDRRDDDTIYIQPTKSAAAALPALGLVGGTVGAVGAYALVQKMVNNIRKKQLQSDLDAEQEKLQGALDKERQAYKQAAAVDQGNSGSNVGDNLLAMGLGIPLIAMLASGALTKRTLDKSYPSIGKTPAKLKRIEFADTPNPNKDLEDQAASEEEQVVKEASYQEFDDAGYEFLASVVSHMGGDNNTTNDIINAAAHGLLPQMEETIKSAGAEAVLGNIEGIPQADERNRALAVMGLTKSAALAPTFKLVAASEFAEKMPTMLSVMSFEDEEEMVKMSHFANLMGVEARVNAFPEFVDEESDKSEEELVKQASLPSLRELIQSSIMSNLSSSPGMSEEVAEDMDSSLNSDVNGKSMGTGQELAQGEINDESDASKDDPIDMMMSGSKRENKVDSSDMAVTV